MKNLYHIFGLNIASDIDLPATPLAEKLPPAPDVRIEYGAAPQHLEAPRQKGVRYEAAPGEFLLRVDNVARYFVQKGNTITIQPEADAPQELVLLFLMGSAIGALLHQRNVLVLHAGAIEAGGHGIIFSGLSGVGKSTLAAGFHQRGYAFLADDVCAVSILEGKACIIPGFPRLKLWADALKKLEKDHGALASVRLRQDMEKYFLPVENDHQKPVPVKTVFILNTANHDDMKVTALNAGEKIEPIINNTYRLKFLNGLGGKKEHFQLCAAVAAQTSVYRVVRPSKAFLLSELMDMLEKYF